MLSQIGGITLQNITRLLEIFKRDKRGISNVIVVMLSLILIVIIASNVVLWSFQMNQFDWEKMQEKIELNYAGNKSPWFTSRDEYLIENGSLLGGTHEDTWSIDNIFETFMEESHSTNTSSASWPSSYHTLNATQHVLGSLTNLQKDDGAYMTFRSYASKTTTGIFGSTTQGSSYTTVSADRMYGSLFTSPPSSVIARNITFYGRSTSGTQTRNVKCLIVRRNDLRIIAVTNPVSVTATPQWRTAIFPSPPTLSPNTEYILMLIPDGTIRFYYTTGSTSQGCYDTSNSYASPIDPTDASHNNNQYCIYCGYDQPAEYAVEVEFTGNSAEPWAQLIWTIDSHCTADAVSVTFQLYNYQMGGYPNQGEDGYMIVTIGTTDYTATLSIENPTYFRDENGNWKMRAICVKSTSEQFDWEVDLIELKSESQGALDSTLSIVGDFILDLSAYPTDYINSVEINICFRASDVLEDWLLEVYDWSTGQYVDVIQATPATGFKSYTAILADDWQFYVNNNGAMKLKFCDVNPDADPTTIYMDFLGVRLIINGTRLNLKNCGASTAHIVSIWIINANIHERYDENLFLNSGESMEYIRGDIPLPNGNFMVKIVTEKGNIASFSGG